MEYVRLFIEKQFAKPFLDSACHQWVLQIFSHLKRIIFGFWTVGQAKSSQFFLLYWQNNYLKDRNQQNKQYLNHCWLQQVKLNVCLLSVHDVMLSFLFGFIRFLFISLNASLFIVLTLHGFELIFSPSSSSHIVLWLFVHVLLLPPPSLHCSDVLNRLRGLWRLSWWTTHRMKDLLDKRTLSKAKYVLFNSWKYVSSHIDIFQQM